MSKIRVYCHGKVVDAVIRDGHCYCTCCGRPLAFVDTYLFDREKREKRALVAG